MNNKLFTRLLMYFTVIILFSLAVLGVSFYIQTASELDKQSEQYIAQVINNTSYQTDLYLQTYERLSTSILVNNHVKKFLDLDPTDYYGRYEYSKEIIKNVFTQPFNMYPQINLAYVLAYNGNSLFYDGQGLADTSSLNKTEHLEMLKQLTPDNGAFVLIKNSVLKKTQNSTITIARKIRGVQSYVPNGILAIEIDSSKIEEVWQNVELAKNGYFFILDANGQAIYYPEHKLKDPSVSESFINVIFNNSENHFIKSVAGEKWLFVSRESDYSQWRLVMALPLSELRSPISTVRITAITVGGIVLIIALLLAYRFSHSITKPIQILKNGMRETVKGNWKQIEYVSNSRDEIGGLVHAYNIMVNRLEEMINQVYKVELNNSKQALELQTLENEKQTLEFQALQLQINPHFLYNTLETINCYAIVKDSEEISEIVEAMAFMLRYSLRTKLDEITLVNELNHIRNYLLILKYRIQREFEIEIEVPPALLLEKMVRLTLQPLLENIFQHAFPDGIEPYHSIRIGAEYTEHYFQVTVEDNGAGITVARLEQLREKLNSNWLQTEEKRATEKGGGIGMINVHRRIQMVFGEQYGLSIDSELGNGVKITMRMPKMRI
ncbi:MAG TPA: histidine kinase [Candidatus Paenibacillus intestinavium]|nr:histidine kinase [Candidatus Paenibacillus intestinavium]